MADCSVICPWCLRTIGIHPQGYLYRHDNRNHSGWCKGSLMPVAEGPDLPVFGGDDA